LRGRAPLRSGAPLRGQALTNFEELYGKFVTGSLSNKSAFLRLQVVFFNLFY
jgi:hypothetical protein